MNSPSQPLNRIVVGVVVERVKAASQWIDYTWRATSLLPDAPDLKPWTVLRDETDATSFYVGDAAIELHRSETTYYRDNLATGAPGVWVVMAETGGDPPYRVVAVTVDPSEGEGFTETATYLVEQVPMPESVREAVAAFVAEHHVEQPFIKRKRDRANTEALGRRRGGGSSSAGDLARRGYGDHDD